MNTGARLDAGFLISGNDQFVLLEPAPLPDPLIQIEDAARLVGELRVPGKDPAAMLPGPDSVFIQPAPDGAIADGGNQATATNVAGHLADTPSGQWLAEGVRQFTGRRLDVDDHLWGEKPGVAPVGRDPPGRPSVFRRISYATC